MHMLISARQGLLQVPKQRLPLRHEFAATFNPPPDREARVEDDSLKNKTSFSPLVLRGNRVKHQTNSGIRYILFPTRRPDSTKQATSLLEEHGGGLHAAGKSARLLDRMAELLSDGNLKVRLSLP